MPGTSPGMTRNTKSNNMSLSPTGFLRIGSSDLEYRMIGPCARGRADHRDAA